MDVDATIADVAAGNPVLPAGLPADWHFQHDLPCPRCCYNLRMLREPRCPECGELFRWQMLLGVDCPRCGESLARENGRACGRCELELDWAALFGDASVVAKYGERYEYSKRPVRAAVRTAQDAIRPVRFWRGFPLEMAPYVPRLRSYQWGMVFLAVALLVLPLAVEWAAPATWKLRGAYFGGVQLVFVLNLMLMPPLVTAVALPLFTPTLARFRVRSDQIARCVAYGFSYLVWAALWVLLAVGVTWVWNALTPAPVIRGVVFTRDTVELDVLAPIRYVATKRALMWTGTRAKDAIFNLVLVAGLLALCWVWWWRFLYVALAGYLRLARREVWALLASTQVIGLLAMLIVACLFGDFLFYVGLLIMGIF